MTFKIMKQYTKFLGQALLSLLAMAFTSCNDIPVGYLQTENAAFTPNVIQAYRNVPEGDPHVDNGAPWTSLRIQGVAGTNPINYEYVGVKVADGANAEAFTAEVKKGNIKVMGGIVQMFPQALKSLSNGKYTLTLRVYNEGHSALLEDIITFDVQDNMPEEVYYEEEP